MKKILGEKWNTISAAVNESVVIGEKNNFVADEKIIEVKENVEKDANDIVKEIVVKNKIVEEVSFEEKGNESDVIDKKINLVANEKNIEVKENVEKDANDIVKEIEEVIVEEKGKGMLQK